MSEIAITLRDNQGLLRGWATTGTQGTASFTNLLPETYILWADIPAMYRTTTEYPDTVHLSANTLAQSELGLTSALPPHYLPFLLKP